MVGLFEVFVVGLVEHILTTDFPSSPRHTRSDAHTHTHAHIHCAGCSFFFPLLEVLPPVQLFTRKSGAAPEERCGEPALRVW